MAKGKIHIGASGWHYVHWKEVFYPEKMQPKDYLPFYAQHFSTTEINNTFYHLPKDSVIDHWVEQVPAKFIFSLKASGYITLLKEWKAKIEHWSQQNITVYCYFDNDEKSFAVKDAKTLLDLLKIK